MPTTPPALGYGQRTEAPINAVNQYMRSAPWYQTLIKSFGQDPNNVHLNDSQKQQVIRAAQANGITVDEGHNGQEVDASGNFQAKSHALRNTLIVAGIAGAALLTAGAAGVFGGAAAGGGAASAGAGGAAAAGAGGTLGSTVIGAGFVPGIAGGTGLAAGAGAAGAGVAGTGGAMAAAGHYLASSAGSSVLGTAGNIFSNIYGANKAANANSEAARLADAATQRAEQFSREQAEGGWQSTEHTQHANYDQWRARQNAVMDSLGTQLGIRYTAPDYSPGIDPRYTGGAASPTGAPSGPSSSAPSGIDWNAPAPQLAASLSAFYKSKGVSDHEVPYWVSKAPELVARGKEINNPNYANERLAASDVFGGGNGTAPAAPKPLAPTFARPNFVPVPTPYQPGTLGAYVGS